MSEQRDDGDAPVLEGRYANFLRVGHNAFEFLIEFAQMYAGAPEPETHTRIITSPVYAKAFSHTLQESLQQYERTHGSIPDADDED